MRGPYPASLPVSYLFVPALAIERIPKALASGADRVIIDLEDAIAPDDKDEARKALSELELSVPIVVRINGRGTPHYEADLNVVRNLPFVESIMLPKVERAEDVQAIRNYIPSKVGVLALVESALGILNAQRIASIRPERLVFGSADFLADIGVSPSLEVLAAPRTALVLASAAAGLASPVDGPTLTVRSEEVVHRDAEAARSLGLFAKLCIHPAQVATVNRVFGVTEEERRWARGVLDAAEEHPGGVFMLDGQMIDEPVLRRARLMLGRSVRTG